MLWNKMCLQYTCGGKFLWTTLFTKGLPEEPFHTVVSWSGSVVSPQMPSPTFLVETKTKPTKDEEKKKKKKS